MEWGQVIFVVLFVLLLLFGFFLYVKADNDSDVKDTELMIYNHTKLDEISRSLRLLDEYLEKQRQSLSEYEESIKKLEKLKIEQNKIISTDKDAVDAILKTNLERQRKHSKKNRYIDLMIGFVLGILSSGIVSYVFIYFGWN